jgi:hypothetical protein
MREGRDRKAPPAREAFVSQQPTSQPIAEPHLLDIAFARQPALQLIYDTAPIGLAFLSPDCRYLQINQRLTEICGI